MSIGTTILWCIVFWILLTFALTYLVVAAT